MKAVILAAGFGKRLSSLGIPKPLVKLFGLPLIEHKLVKLKGHPVAVVYHHPQVGEFLRKRYPDVTLIYNPHPERENGYSLYLAKDFVGGEPFLLLMADHYYGEEFFKQISPNVERTTLFVSQYATDPQEATKVKTEGIFITKIGKELKDFNYFDTGFFICHPEVFKYAEELLNRKEKLKLSEVMQALADDRKLLYKKVDGFWIDIDTPRDLRVAEKAIEKSLIKPTDGLVSRFLNRKISAKISRLLMALEFLTPNIVTIITTLLGIAAAVPFLLGEYLLGGLLLQLASILDGCDGEIARIKNLKSPFGALLDSVADRYVDTLAVFFIFLSLPKDLWSYWALYLSLTGSIMVSYVSHLGKIRPLFATRDLRIFLIFLFSIAATFLGPIAMLVLLWVLGLLTHLAVVYVLYKNFRLHKFKN